MSGLRTVRMFLCITSYLHQQIRVTSWGKFINHNAFRDSASLARAQRNSTDQNSVVGNPMFLNPASDNYQVAAGYPALKCGFINFEMDKFGVVSPGLKAKAKKIVIPAAISIAEQKGNEIYDFIGIKIKNLTTLGERSAT